MARVVVVAQWGITGASRRTKRALSRVEDSKFFTIRKSYGTFGIELFVIYYTYIFSLLEWSQAMIVGVLRLG